MDTSSGTAASSKPKIECPGCSKKFVSLNGHLARASGPCAIIRAQRIIDNTPGPSNHTTQPENIDTLTYSRNITDPPSTTPQLPEFTSEKNPTNILVKESERFFTEIDKYLLQPPTQDNFDSFDKIIKEFTAFLFKSNSQLPGPIHPAVSYHRKRRNKRDIDCDRGNSQTSNPQRYSKRRKKKISDQFKYDLIQWQYANQRRKVARTLLNAKKPTKLKMEIPAIEQYYRSLFEISNNRIRDTYEPSKATDEVFSLTKDNIELSIKKISIDTSPGSDGIVLRTIRNVKCTNAIWAIGKVMLKWNYVPLAFRTGRTILIYKEKGDEQNPQNWRPITIFSIIRRIIERSLDQALRARVKCSQVQRGFINGMPGAHINSSLIEGCLKTAKEKGDNCCIVMLDLAKAFDMVGHDHLRHTLKSLSLPNNLQNLVISLATSNSTKIEVNKQTTDYITLSRGVAQGSPLSPTIFNLCQDFALKLISDIDISKIHGYELSPTLDKLSALAFADDTAIIARNEESAIILVETLQLAFKQVGMVINPEKSSVINIQKGQLSSNNLMLSDRSTIRAIKLNEQIKYLGINYTDSIVFDKKKFITDLEKDFRMLITSPLLRGDQKLNILEQYVFPKLIYPMQTTPLDLLERPFLESIDSIMRQGVREIVGLPADTPLPVYYTGRKLRGLGILRVTWEASLQHINICQTLLKINDSHLHIIRNMDSEIKKCRDRLGGVVGNNVRAIRAELRALEFDKWSQMPQRGAGVKWYKSFTPANSWVSNKLGITSSDWCNGIKMSMNSMANRSTGGRSLGNRHCRNPPCSEKNTIETLSHIRGSCPRSELLRNSAHHKIRTQLANLFRNKGLEVHEEVHCLAQNEENSHQNRRADIVILDRTNNKGTILDPTLRWETNEENQDKLIDEEKKSIYEPTIPFFKEKYHISDWEVHGLWFGARGTASPLLKDFFKKNKLEMRELKEMCLVVMRDTLNIIHKHIYY